MQSTMAMGAMAAAGEAMAQTGGSRAATRPEFLELRIFKLRTGPQPKLMNDFLGEVYLPLLNKLNVKPVGAFTVTFGPEMPSIYLLSPYPSLAEYQSVRGKLEEELRKSKAASAQAFLTGAGASAPYVRVDTQLLTAFDNMPRLELPAASAKREPRIFELRVYETAGEDGQRKKIEMFGTRMGELAIFRRVGLAPVFFASSLVGPRQPSFSYLLTFPDLAAREAAWKRFREDPEWAKLKVTPGYTDPEIMQNIADFIVTPTAYSQI
jgi:hypothetical protein